MIDDLFGGELDEQAILKKHRIKKSTYNQWLADENFQAQLVRRIDTARLMSEVLIAKYSVVAAAKLVQLTASEKEETARKACLDIILMPGVKPQKPREDNESPSEQPFDCAQDRLSDETASRLLAALAEEKSGGQPGAQY